MLQLALRLELRLELLGLAVVADGPAPADDLAALDALRPVVRDERGALPSDDDAEAGQLLVPDEELRLVRRPRDAIEGSLGEPELHDVAGERRKPRG